jgi:hypothetical protein
LRKFRWFIEIFTKENENALAERWLVYSALSREDALKQRELRAKVPVVVVVKSETEVRV